MLIVGGQQAIRDSIREVLSDATGKVVKDLQGIKSLGELAQRVKDLRKQVEELEISKSRREEDFARREREIEHKVGLERKRQEFELDAAKREATLSVREENLKADRERFEGQMSFHEKRFTEEVTYLKEMIGTLADRLPSLEMTAKVGGKRGLGR